MRNFILRLAIGAMVLGLAPYGARATETPSGTSNLQSMTVAELEKAGDEARAQKDYRQAVKYFEEAIRKDRKNAILYNKLGMTELKDGQLEAARMNFQQAVKRNSKFADALSNIGAVYYMQNNFSAAAKHFKKAVALDENRATFHVNLGAAWFGQKKLDRAVAEYARALELDPDALSNKGRAGLTAQIANAEERAKFSYMLAKIYAKRGDAEQCLRCLRMAKEEGYRDLASVYKDEEFASLRQDKRLAEITPPPQPK